MILLAAPTHIAAAEVKVSYEDYQKTIIQRPACDPVKGASPDDCFYHEPRKAASTPTYACNCVLWAQAQGLGMLGYGAARNYPVTSQTPAAEGFVVTYEGPLGHIAHYILSGQYLLLQEANYKPCQITTDRILPVNSPLIKGFI